jgi:hypothetical protein
MLQDIDTQESGKWALISESCGCVLVQILDSHHDIDLPYYLSRGSCCCPFNACITMVIQIKPGKHNFGYDCSVLNNENATEVMIKPIENRELRKRKNCRWHFQGPTRLSLQWSCFTCANAATTLPMASAVNAMDDGSTGDRPLDRNVNLSDRVTRVNSRDFAATSRVETDVFV